jgi:hypothetical protein
MHSGNVLDRLIERFQHRWETDRQWRAAMSAALALLATVGLCAGVLGVSRVATGILTGLGFITGSQPQDSGAPDTGARLVNGQLQFPTPTESWTVGTPPPVSTIANSQTPVPSATSAPTPSPTPTSGGGGPANCMTHGGGGTTSLSPCPQIHGQSGTLTITTSKRYAGAQLNILLNLGSCSDNCTYDWPPGTYALDTNGNVTITYQVPHDANVNPTPISGMVNIAGGPTLSIQGPPVQ